MTDVKELLKGIPACACGKAHLCPIDAVEIGADALSKLPQLCEKYDRIMLVADANTYAACGNKVDELLGGKITCRQVFETGKDVLIPDETSIAAIEEACLPDVQLIVGVGSGVINDLCKYVSFFRNIPYFIVATAPSMDGYASVGAAMILKGMKATVNAAPPKAILADTEVIRNAPMEMLQAGWGDIVGKFSCLNDWKLSALIRDEYFCQEVYDLTYSTAERVKNLAAGVVSRDAEAAAALMEALVAVGIAMSYVGNSRPASGSEHHLSHFFEITGILENKPYLAHGIDVIYSAVATAKLREQILTAEPHGFTFDREAWEGEIRRIYTASADEVIKLQDKLGWYNMDEESTVRSKLPEIRALLAEAPTAGEMLQLVESIGLDYNAFVELYGAEKIETALTYAKDLKDRYTVLWLYYQYFG